MVFSLRLHTTSLNSVAFETPTIWSLGVLLQQAITLKWNEIYTQFKFHHTSINETFNLMPIMIMFQ